MEPKFIFNSNYFNIALLNLTFLFVISCKQDQTSTTSSVDPGNMLELDSIWNSLDENQKESLIWNLSAMYTTASTVASTVGQPIRFGRADTLITNYHTARVSNDSSARSVYFSLEELERFFEIARRKNDGQGLCQNMEERGVRIYFAQHRNDTTFGNQETVIVRLACNGEDIDHQDSTGIMVAYDYGDVCPPKCELNQLSTRACTKGYYKKTGSPEISCH